MRTLFIIICFTLFPICSWGQFNPSNPDEPTTRLPEASFFADAVGNKVKCTNYSTGAIRFLWNFGDGTTSKEKSLVHTYKEPGDYTITLTAFNARGESSYTSNVKIDKKENWVLSGDFTLDKNSTDIRNYTNLNDFFNDLLNLRYNSWSLNVVPDQKFELTAIDLTASKDVIIQKIQKNVMSEFKIRGQGNYNRSAFLKLWPAFNKQNFQAFLDLSKHICFSDLSIGMGNEIFYLSGIKGQNKQSVLSGDKTQETGFLSFSSTFQYEWRLKKNPKAVTGYLQSGTGEIPNMKLYNQSGDIETLEYEVSFKYGGEVYLTVPYTIEVYPETLKLTNLDPKNKSVLPYKDDIWITWNLPNADRYSSDFYIWEEGTQQPLNPSRSGAPSSVLLSNFCQREKTYCWKLVCSGDFYGQIESEVYTFSIAGGRPDLAVQSISLSGTTLQSYDPLSVTATIINKGGSVTSSSQWKDQLYISDQKIFDENKATLLGTVTHNGDVASAGQYEVDFNVTVPHKEGVKYLFVKTDVENNLKDDPDPANNLMVSDPIKVTLKSFDEIRVVKPKDKTLLSSNRVDFSWTENPYAKEYKIFIWPANEQKPLQPTSTTRGGHFAYDCQYGKSYKWQVTGWDGETSICEGPQYTFTILEMADLHVTNVECGDAWAGKDLEVSWTVKNDGKGNAKKLWKDNIFLVQDLSKGVKVSPVVSLDHKSDLISGQSYLNRATIRIDRQLEGSYYLVVASDMSAIEKIDWSLTENKIPDPYQPNISGTPYPFLKGQSDGGVIAEPGESEGYSDNFFYKKVNIHAYEKPQVERIENMMPVHQELLSTDAVDFSWKGTSSVEEYDFYVWPVDQEKPARPKATISSVRYTLKEYCQFGKSYQWQVVGLDRYGDIVCESPQNLFTIKKLPDLHVTEVKCGEAWSGQALNVSWTVRNDGKASTNGVEWQDKIWLAPSFLHGIDGASIKTVKNMKTLAPGESYTNTATIQIDERISGPYYLVVASDIDRLGVVDWTLSGGKVPDLYEPSLSGTPYPYLNVRNNTGSLLESGEKGGRSDNFFYKKIAINVSDVADLQVKTVNGPTLPSFAGHQVNVVATIVNAGKKAISPNTTWVDEVFISPFETFDPNTAKSLGYFHNYERSLGAGQEYNAAFEVNIPSYMKDGDYYFYVKTDIYDAVYEHALAENNVTRSTDKMHVINENVYELKALDVNFSPKDVGNASILTIQGRGQNAGVMMTEAGSWLDDVYASKNADRLDDSAIFLSSIEHRGILFKGEEYSINGEIPIHFLPEGDYYIYLVINSEHQAADNDESNNIVRSQSTFKVHPSDLAVSDLSIPSVMNGGCKYTVTYTIQNLGLDINGSIIYNKIEILDKDEKVVSSKLENYPLSIKQGQTLRGSSTIYLPKYEKDGDYYIRVFVNSNSHLQESVWGNNQSEKKSFRYTRHKTDETGKPRRDPQGNLIEEPILDLSFRSVDVPKNVVQTNTAFYVDWMVENRGEAAVDNQWEINIYAKGENILELLKSVKEEKIYVNQLRQGGTSILLADRYKDITELVFEIAMADGNMENNRMIVPLKAEHSPIPDLRVKNLKCTPLVAGKSATITYEVDNIGVGKTPAVSWNDRVFLIGDNSPSGKDFLKTEVISKVLQPGGSYKGAITFDVPKNYKGNYNLFLVINESGDLYEGGRNENNIGYQPVTVVLPPAEPVDLAVENVNVQSSYQVGDYIPIRWTVRNLDKHSISGELKDAIYLSLDKQWDMSDVLIGTVSGSISMKGEERLERVAKGIIKNVMPGTYYVIVRTNQLNSIKELNYANNVSTAISTCQVDFPELTIGSSVAVNGLGFFKLKADPDETLQLRLEADGTQKGFQLYMAHDHAVTVTEYDYSSVQPNEPYQEIVIPEMKAGTYYILAQQQTMVSGVDNNFSLGETVPEENRIQMTLSSTLLQFGLTRLDKPEGGLGGSATSVATGAKFDSIMDFRLKRNQTILPAEALYFQNSSEVQVTFDLKDKGMGTYDVVVEKPGGVTAELKSGYKITQEKPNQLLIRSFTEVALRLGKVQEIVLEYANEGTTDVEVSEFFILSENGHSIGVTPEETKKGITEIRIPLIKPGTNQPLSIAPGKKGTIRFFTYPTLSEIPLSLKIQVIE